MQGKSLTISFLLVKQIITHHKNAILSKQL